MDRAKYWDNELNEFCFVEAANYKGGHEGMLLCPDINCNAAVHFRKGGMTQAGAQNERNCFETWDNSVHWAGCAHCAENKGLSDKSSIEEALLAGKYILININFPTSFRTPKELGYSDSFLRKVKDNDARFYKDWLKENRRTKTRPATYVPRSARNVDDIISIADHVKALSDRIKDPMGRILVGYYPGIIPWRDFYADPENEKVTEVFNHLVEKEPSLSREKSAIRSWMPRLREIVLNGHQRDKHTLIAQGYQQTNLSGTSIKLADRITLSGEPEADELMLANRFFVVATPSLVRHSLRNAKEGGYVNLDWPICSRSQVSFLR